MKPMIQRWLPMGMVSVTIASKLRTSTCLPDATTTHLKWATPFLHRIVLETSTFTTVRVLFNN